MKNDILVCVIGGNHHNMLGIIRMLGKQNIRVCAIIVNGNKYSFCTKSKYLTSYTFAKTEEEILNEIKKLPKKTFLIPTGDDTAYLIDKNYKKLSKNYIVPSIDNIEGQMEKYMNKFYQNEMIKSYGLKSATSYEINLEEIIPEFKKYPLIIKPLYSIDGQKDDITIINSKKELYKSLEEYKKKNYKRAIIQEYINMDYEAGLNGCACNGKVVTAAVLKKERRFPVNRGNVSYGEIIPIVESKLNLEPINNMLKDINYNGLFDIELFVCGNNYYVNEINFRNSGNSIAYSKNGVNIPNIWLALNLNQADNIKLTVDEKYWFRDEILELKLLVSRNISIKQYFKALLKSKISFVFDIHDIKPYITFVLNHIRRK